MVELREQPDGQLRRSYGGDTLNTAVYLARLGVAVDYVTALGDDAWSGEMLAGWEEEGIGTRLVYRLPGRLPGLYIIQTDPQGERRFLYWRDSAAARQLFDHLELGGTGWRSTQSTFPASRSRSTTPQHGPHAAPDAGRTPGTAVHA